MRTEQTCQTHWVEIYLAGPIQVAEQVIREYCYEVGFCVTVTPTKYIYTGGEEVGYIVKLINYARFPSTVDSIDQHASNLAELLVKKTFQKSYTIMTPTESKFVSVMEK